MQNRYGFGKSMTTTFEVAVETVTRELQKEGFGILTEIDVAATLKKKLNYDTPPYCILGACNPPFALRALAADGRAAPSLRWCGRTLRAQCMSSSWIRASCES